MLWTVELLAVKHSLTVHYCKLLSLVKKKRWKKKKGLLYSRSRSQHRSMNVCPDGIFSTSRPFRNQNTMWWCAASLWAEVSCVHVTVRAHASKYDIFHNILWSADPFVDFNIWALTVTLVTATLTYQTILRPWLDVKHQVVSVFRPGFLSMFKRENVKPEKSLSLVFVVAGLHTRAQNIDASHTRASIAKWQYKMGLKWNSNNIQRFKGTKGDTTHEVK